MLREKEQFLKALRSRGQRVTRERLALLDEIFLQHQHIDADSLLGALHQRGYAISRATVYRNLELLVTLGLVRKTRLGHDRYHYEHVHAGQDHDHLVCTGCGRVVEFLSPGIAALQAEICRAHGFVPSRHSLEILGLCNACAGSGDLAPFSTDAPPRSEPAAGRLLPGRAPMAVAAAIASQRGSR